MEIRSRAQEAREDVFFGQLVMIWSRWAIIAVATFLTVWTARSEGDLVRGIALVVVLMAINFYLHGRHMTERPANRLLVQVAAVADLAVITAMIAASGGFGSQLFVLYYPVLLAFALVFPPRLAALFGAGCMALYAASFLAGFPATMGNDKETLMRLLTLAAMTGLGTFYWRAQRERRRRSDAA